MELAFLRLARVDLSPPPPQPVSHRLLACLLPSLYASDITYHRQNRNYILRIRLSQGLQIPESVLPEQTGSPPLHESHLGHFKEVGSGACFEAIAHVVQHGGQHAPVHALAEFYHACCEAVALLGEGLYGAAGDAISGGDGC